MNSRRKARHAGCTVGPDMSWEQRLREMVLAGGALAAAACGPSTASPSDAGSDATSGDDFAFCCNASSDPCCALSCGVGADAAAYGACEENLTDCGVNGTYGQRLDGTTGCVSRIPPVDAAPSDPYGDSGGCN